MKIRLKTNFSKKYTKQFKDNNSIKKDGNKRACKKCRLFNKEINGIMILKS